MTVAVHDVTHSFEMSNSSVTCCMVLVQNCRMYRTLAQFGSTPLHTTPATAKQTLWSSEKQHKLRDLECRKFPKASFCVQAISH